MQLITECISDSNRLSIDILLPIISNFISLESKTNNQADRFTIRTPTKETTISEHRPTSTMNFRNNNHTMGFLATAMHLLVASSFLFGRTEAALKAGDTICVEGYVMDFFCINRGTLLDNPSVRTLEGPGEHSVHCLIDVNSCVSSPFEILLDPKEGELLYKRGWQLDEASKQRAIELAQSVGSCTKCDPGNNRANSHVKGFRMALTATILNLNEDNASLPPTIQAIDIMDTTAFVPEDNGGDSACSFFFEMEDILDVSVDDGESGGGGSIIDSIAVGSAAGAGDSLRTTHFIHGSLMMVSWGFLLPSGTLLAKFYKHRPDGLWFKLHRGIQMLGLLLALIGWIIALMNFNVFKDYGFRNYQHGICGMVVMILGLIQPLNALIRPHPPSGPEDEKSTKRWLWEIWHKSSGWIAVGLAVPTIVLGTLSLPNLEDQSTVQIGYGIGCIGGLLLLTACIFYDKKTFEVSQREPNDGKDSRTEEQAA